MPATADYLWLVWRHSEDAEWSEKLSACHARCARRLLHMCFANAGVYIKMAQHVAQLVRHSSQAVHRIAELVCDLCSRCVERGLELVLLYTLRYEDSVQRFTCEYSTAGQSPTVLYVGGGIGGALGRRSGGTRAPSAQACASSEGRLSIAYDECDHNILLLHRCCPGGGMCVGNGAGRVIISLSQRSGSKQTRAQRGNYLGIETCVRIL